MASKEKSLMCCRAGKDRTCRGYFWTSTGTQRNYGNGGPYVCAHVPSHIHHLAIQVSPSSFYPALLLHSPSFIVFQGHASSPPPPPSSIENIDGLFSLFSHPLFPSPTLFLSFSNYVRCREWMDSGSVFIGSVISTACSHAPLRG